MSDEIPDDLRQKSQELWNEMDDNTQFNTDGGKLRFAKLNLSAEDIDTLIDHYGFFDVVETNVMAIKILNVLAKMEKDGYKFTSHSHGEDGKPDKVYMLDIPDLIGQIRIILAKQLKDNDEKGNV